jgi:hypothetical protein
MTSPSAPAAVRRDVPRLSPFPEGAPRRSLLAELAPQYRLGVVSNLLDRPARLPEILP